MAVNGGRPTLLSIMWTRTRLTERLSLRLPIIQGAFGGGLSTPELAAAVARAGGLGSYGAHHLPPDRIGPTVAAIRALTGGPFAINLWVPLPGEPTAFDGPLEPHLARLRPYLGELGLGDPAPPARVGQPFGEQLRAALDAAPPALSFVFGVPPADALAEARSRRIATIGTATTVDEAVALDRAGVDVIVASGSDAGGHRTSFLRAAEDSLVGTLSLVPQVVDAVSAPVVAAGGIADGRGIAAALALGASGAQLGTTFLACDESGASEAHKRQLGQPGARHTLLTRAFSGRLARGIVNRMLRELRPVEHELPAYPLQNWLTTPIRQAAGRAGQPDLLALWAGQAAALSPRRPAAACMEALVSEVERALGRVGVTS